MRGPRDDHENLRHKVYRSSHAYVAQLSLSIQESRTTFFYRRIVWCF